MARTTAKEVNKQIQETLNLETEPTGQEVAHAMYMASSPSFRASIGDPNEVNSLDFMNGLLDYPETLATEWVNLATRIGRTIAHKNILKNKLAPFKMTEMPLGYTMEEFFVDVAKEHEYNQAKAETEQFKRELPDIKSRFYVVNRKSFYKQTITDDDLRSYFVSWDGVSSLIAKIVDALYNGDNKDDYNYMKSALVSHYENGYMKIVKTDAVTDNATAKSLATKITEYIAYLTEPTSEYNGAGVIKQNDYDEIYVILNAKSNAFMNVEWLSQTFQLDIADFKAHVLVIPTLPNSSNGTIEAMIVDREIYRVFDQKYAVTVKYNGEGLYWNYWLHHWEGIATSQFANAIAFVSGVVNEKVTGFKFKENPVTVAKGKSVVVPFEVLKTGTNVNKSLVVESKSVQLKAEILPNLDAIKITGLDGITQNGLGTVELRDTVSSVKAILNVVYTTA